MILFLSVVFVLAFIFIVLLIRFAPRLYLLDTPNIRSTHQTPTPAGAGIGIFSSVMIAIALFYYDLLQEHYWMFLALFTVWVIGVWDDMHHSSPPIKFLFIVSATLLLSLDGTYISHLGIFGGFLIELHWLAIPFTLFVVAGFTNSFNLIDGLDGLSGSLGIVILAAFWHIGREYNDIFMQTISLAFMAALLAFLLFNWNPAKIFMGDSGSLMLGFVISLLSIHALAYIQPIKILYIAAIPILDTLIVIVRRKRRGKSAMFADKTHLHHILLGLFDGSVKQAVFILVATQIFFTLVGIVHFNSKEQFLGIFLFILTFMVSYLTSTALLRQQEKVSQNQKELKVKS